MDRSKRNFIVPSNYKELIKELRKYFYDEPLVMDAADAIEHLLIESNNYRKALEAMS